MDMVESLDGAWAIGGTDGLKLESGHILGIFYLSFKRVSV